MPFSRKPALWKRNFQSLAPRNASVLPRLVPAETQRSTAKIRCGWKVASW